MRTESRIGVLSVQQRKLKIRVRKRGGRTRGGEGRHKRDPGALGVFGVELDGRRHKIVFMTI